MRDSNSESCYSGGIRQRVCELLSKNPLLTPKSICKLLDLSYESYGAYVNNCKSAWKSNTRNEHGSKCSIHAWRGWCYVPGGVDRAKALDAGWVLSRVRNRWLLWKDRLGIYKILVQHDVLGNRHRTVNLDSNYDLTVEYTDADEAGGGPLAILPQWDLSSEQGLLFIAIPIGAVLLYAGSTVLRSKKKWKYSYL